MPKDTNVVETSNANKVFDIPVKLEPGQINTLSFDQDSISQMRELPNGELEIGFRDGSKVVVENFDELVNSAQSCGRDTLIQLSDNTIIYPEELAAQLAKGPVSFEGNIDASGAVLLDQPKAGQIIEKNIQAGQEYKLGFSLDSTVSAAQAGQNLILTFKDGGVLVLNNYYTAMESDLPPAMTLADGSVIDANALLTSCKLVEIPAIADSLAANVAEGKVVEGVPVVEPAAGEEKAEEVAANAARKGKAGKDGPPDVEPAAGDEPTDVKGVANIEPAAGDAGNQISSSSRGYGFGSSIDGAALNGANPVGPIGATALRYGAEFPIGDLNPGQEDPFVDTQPVVLSGGETVDETNLGPLSVSGNANADFGANGPGTVTFNPTFVPGGSLAGGALTSHGVPVVVSLDPVTNIYTGVAGGTTVFTIALDPATGDYTFTQYAPLDHADGSDPNDLITLQFGVNATDSDNDVGSGTITIGVCDDAPIALDDGNTVGTGPLFVTGNVTDNDDAGSDGATVTQVVFNGTIYTVPAVGTVAIVATYGTLVIGANGAYTYTSSNTAEGTDQFTYTLTDYDGDQDTAVLSVEVSDIDTTPKVTPSVGQVDETNLTPTTSVVGSVGADFGDDGPGAFNLTGAPTPGGSLLGGALTSNGFPVISTLVGNTITGVANGVVIFTITLDPATGAYTYTQSGPLDHADGTDPNDVITLQFGVNAVDADGDATPTTITISVLDDGPVAANDSNTVAPGMLSVDGNVTGNDSVGEDQPGYVVTQVTFGGTTVAVPLVGTVTINGTYGSLTIAKDGSYTYTSFNTAEGTDNFTYQIRDRDGDTANAKLTIDVPDVDSKPVIGDDAKTVDETNLGPNVVGGNISGNFGDDGPGSFELTTFTFGGSVKDGVLQSCGDAITVSKVEGGYVGIDADGVTVFTLTLNALTGDYTFTQFKAIDHANTSDPNDALTLQFGVTGTDSDGDSDTGMITITILDDGPRADDDHNEFDSNVGHTDGNVITGVNGGPGADDVLSKDGGNKVTNISYKGVDYPVPASGETTINGDYGVLKIKADGSYTYTLYEGGAPGSGPGTDGTFAETLDFPVVGEGNPKFNEASPNEGVNPAALDITTSATGTVQILSETAGYSNSLGLYTIAADGTITAAQMVAANVNDLALGGTTNFNIPANGNGVGFFLIADGYNVNGGYAGQDLSTGNLVFYYNYGEADQRIAKVTDSAADITLVYVNGSTTDVISGPVYHTTDRDGANNLNPDGKVHTISGLGDDGDPSTLRIGFEDLPGQGDADFSDVVFDFTYTPTPPQDTCDEFEYTLTDCDGDTDTAILKLCSEDLVDDKPVLTAEIIKVDETVVDNSGAQTVTGAVTVNFGADVPGPVVATGASSFAFSGSATGGNLTSNGVPVVVSLVGNQYVGTAGAVVVFTLTVNTNGSFAFTQHGQLDHANTANPDDVITLNFGVQATDGDGDTGTTTITVNVHDDGPVAVNDTNTVGNAPGTVTGNVTANDDVGEDEPGYVVKQVTFGSTTVDVPASGTVNIVGAHGTLTIAATGAYTYQGTSEGVDQFGYKIVDQDGDPATAKLTITVEGKDDCPTIKNVDVCVDETNLGPLSVTGNTQPNFFGDGPGTVKATGASTFVAGGSLMGGSLKSNGVAVVVTLDTATNTYVGKAGSTTVFNLKVNTDGTFKFTQFDNLDHANASNPNDEITLKFGVTAKDADGDVANGTITVTVKDDAPVAKDDCYTIEDCGCAKIGNVMLNDKVGQDSPGAVKSVTYNGKVYDLSKTGSTTIDAANGKLVLNADGSFVYKPHNNACGSDQFKYTITDYDKDPASAYLKFNNESHGYGKSSVTVTNDVVIHNDDVTTVSYSSHNDVLVMLENSSVVTLKDFDPGEGDVIDLSNLVQGFDPVTDAINDFVFARTEGKDTVVSVDPDGKGSNAQSYDVAVIKDVTGVHVEDIVSLTHTQQNQGGLGTA